jgi:DNA-binding winged helix-turn-helix (wHTH) protein/tetratricopeptide (TPR) repeat protein
MSAADPNPRVPGEAPRSGVLRWPGAELDLRSAQVRRGRQLLALDRSSYEVLLALLLRAGQVLGKDDLLDAAWPGRVVSENSLAKAISRLRRELGDEAGAPLQSVHGYGYRWAGEVHWAESEAPPPAPPAEHDWVGAAVPGRSGWTFRRVLGRGVHSMVLLADSVAGEAPRALKLGLGEDGLRHVRREVALHRYLAAINHSVPGLAPALGWQLDEPPVFVEYPYFEDGDLARWMAARTVGGGVPLGHRLALVAQIADTLGELHAAGVVHQDLKPGNIFLSPDSSLPEGWRTALADLGGGHASPLSQQTEVLLDADVLVDTREARDAGGANALHCAPEVLSGGMPTQRSDLYALGVLLYQLVVGDLRRPLAPGWEADVEDPLLRDDIRALAALRVEERTLGAQQLALHLRQLPARRLAAEAHDEAAARERTAAQQLQRQQVRLRLLGAATAALFVGLAVASWAGWLAWDARRDEAVRRSEAQAVLEFLTDDMLTRADPYRGGDAGISLRSSLDAAAAKIDERLGERPLVAAAVHASVAEAYESWGEYAKAARHQRWSIERTEVGGPDGASLGAQQRRLCQLERLAGNLEPAQTACDAAAAHDRDTFGAVSDASLVEGAKLLYESGRCGEVVGQLGSVLADEPRRTRLPGGVEADARWFIGLCQSRMGEEGAAAESFRALVALRERESGPDDPRTAWAMSDYAEALARAGRFAEADAILERLDRLILDRLGPDHPDSLAVDYRRGLVAAGQGREAEAADAFGRAHRGWGRSLGERHMLTVLAGSELARSLARQGDRQGASAVMARLQLIGQPDTFGRDARAIDIQELWAETLLLLGRTEDAARTLGGFRARAVEVLPQHHPRLAVASCFESQIATRRGQLEAAGVALSACRLGLARLASDDYRRRALADAEQAAGDAIR